jgi:hypothetical protein
MPTEVYDLSPQQLDWLYEHQALINGGAESPSFPMMTTPPSPVPRLIPDVTKNNYILVDVHRRDSLTHGGGSDASTANSTSHNSDGIDSHLTDAEIIMFPFHLDRPSWEQSLTNMMCFKERNGVRGPGTRRPCHTHAMHRIQKSHTASLSSLVPALQCSALLSGVSSIGKLGTPPEIEEEVSSQIWGTFEGASPEIGFGRIPLEGAKRGTLLSCCVSSIHVRREASSLRYLVDVVTQCIEKFHMDSTLHTEYVILLQQAGKHYKSL